MTKNLNYGSSSDTLLTSYDTDLPSGTTFLAPATTTNFATSNNTASYISPRILTDSTYGGYYSFAAAIASTTAYTDAYQNIPTSICPKGWDLPTSTMYNDLRTISGNTTYAKVSAAPYSFIYAGYRNGTNFISQTSTIRLWTSTNYSAQYVYYSAAYNATTYSGNYKRYGESVRCVASNGTATVNYNANDGSGSTVSQTGDINGATISSNLFTAPTGSQFRNWNTSPDGTGTTVTAGTLLSSIASNGDTINLYAQWDEIYYIAFNANGGSGTMTSQTVIRNTATNINTNTFTRSGYIFYGWNTQANGGGTSYGDGQKVTNLTATGNTITLYAVWVEGAYLDTGQNVNQKLKRLAGDSSATYTTADTTITAIIRSNALPGDFTPATANTISHSSSPTPIYVWYDSTNTTIYYYSAATNILMNKTSSYFFYRLRALSNLSTISTWDTTKVTTMRSMFEDVGYAGATSFTPDLSSWNTSNVTDMSEMFYNTIGESGTSSFAIDLSSWNTSSVTSMRYMFTQSGYFATTWTVGDLSSWNTSNVTDMYHMFSTSGFSATAWNVGNLSSWDTSNVTNMSHMFYRAGYRDTNWSLNGISSWNTSKVTDMQNMFSGAGYSASVFTLNLSSWNTSSVTNMSGMFNSAGHDSVTFTLNLSSWDTSNVTNMSSMFTQSGLNATTWSVTIPKTNNGTTTGPITNTTSRFYGKTTSTYGSPLSGKSFTLAN